MENINVGILGRWAKSLCSVVNPTALDRLGAAIFVGSADPNGRLMALFTAYFDASGNSVDQPFVIVSGYIANFQQWSFFEDSWKKIHAKYGVNLPFHVADLLAAVSKPLYKNRPKARMDYVALASDPAQVDEFSWSCR